jgi:hypothetical protein
VPPLCVKWYERPCIAVAACPPHEAKPSRRLANARPPRYSLWGHPKRSRCQLRPPSRVRKILRGPDATKPNWRSAKSTTIAGAGPLIAPGAGVNRRPARHVRPPSLVAHKAPRLVSANPSVAETKSTATNGATEPTCRHVRPPSRDRRTPPLGVTRKPRSRSGNETSEPQAAKPRSPTASRPSTASTALADSKTAVAPARSSTRLRLRRTAPFSPRLTQAASSRAAPLAPWQAHDSFCATRCGAAG